MKIIILAMNSFCLLCLLLAMLITHVLRPYDPLAEWVGLANYFGMIGIFLVFLLALFTLPKEYATKISRAIWSCAALLVLVSFLFFPSGLGEQVDSLFFPPHVSRVAWARADMRAMSIALETYFLDHRAYPAWSSDTEKNIFGGIEDKKGLLKNLPTFTRRDAVRLATLTTPVAYLSKYFRDPLAPYKNVTFCYWHPLAADGATAAPGYILWSPGPDRRYDLTLDNIAQAYDPASFVPSPFLQERTYDPSNGTNSAGDVYRYKQ